MKFRFIVWGAGHNGELVIEYLNSLKTNVNGFDFQILYFVDSDKSKIGCMFNGYDVKKIESISTDAMDCIVIISMSNYRDAEAYLMAKEINKYLLIDELIKTEDYAVGLFEKGDITLKNNVFGYRLLQRKEYKENGKLKVFSSDNDKNKIISQISLLMAEYKEKIEDIDFSITNIPTKKIKTVGIYYTRLHGGGIQRVISLLVPKYIAMGYGVVIITNEITEYDYEFSPEVKILCLKEEPIQPYNWIIQFANIIEENNIDILINHAHAYYRSFYIGLCMKCMGVRYILESHTCIAALLNKNNYSFYEKNYSLADTLVVLSTTDQEYWKQKGIKVTYVPNPILLIDERERKYRPNTVIWVGRIDFYEKNVYEVVPVMKEIVKQCPQVVLNIIGKADNKEIYDELVKRIDANGLSKNIRICGFNKNLEKYYMEAGCIIITSPYEGFPMALVESKCYGVPAVLYKLSGVEVLKDGLGYIEVPQLNYKKMAYEVIKVLNNQDIQEKLSCEARKSIEIIAKTDIAKLWKEVIEGI